MKEDAIKRIHTIGRVGVIITNIYKVLIIVLMLIILVGTIGLFMIPKDLLTLQFDSTVNLQIDPSAVPGDSSDATVKQAVCSWFMLTELLSRSPSPRLTPLNMRMVCIWMSGPQLRRPAP